LKGGYFSYQREEARVIDSNELVAWRLEKLATQMEQNSKDGTQNEDGFQEGLDALRVDQLFEDYSEEGTENDRSVIKAQTVQDGPTYEEIIEQARQEADQIIRDAMEEASNQKQQILEQARKEGFQAGYDDGMKEVSAIKAELSEKSNQLDEHYEKRIEELEPLFIDNLTSIYEHIFHVKLAGNKEIIFYLLQDAVRKIENTKNFIIHVSKEDYGFVSMQKKELLAGVANSDTAEIVEDMTLKASECFIETSGGIFDCSLDTQLTGLTKELKLLSYVKPAN
jgi:flagellar assembly protein FliH